MTRSLQNQIAWHVRAQWALGGLTLISALMFYVIWYRPSTARLASLQRRIDDGLVRLEADESRARNLPVLKAEVYRLQNKLEPFSRKLPRQEDLGGFMKDVSSICQRTSVKKFTYQPGAARRMDAINEKPITMNFEGDFYKEVFTFLREAEEMQRLTRVRSLTIKGKDARSGQVEVQMAMNIYYEE